jgi:hypothetical protein
MVRYTESAHLIPEWVHQFRQWHIDMFESLDEAHQREVDQLGAWVTIPHATFQRLDPSFVIPSGPLLVPVPPDNLPRLRLISSSIRDPPPALYRDDSPELTGPALRAKRLRTRSTSSIFLLTLFLLIYLFQASTKCLTRELAGLPLMVTKGKLVKPSSLRVKNVGANRHRIHEHVPSPS